jgi:molybdenum cofactor synthesis domain-containing protein
VEIIAIGDELCYGRVQDTNSFWIADQITRMGGEVKRITCIKDELDEICGTFRESLSRKPRIIISTGGLGPTSDDRTLDSISKLAKREIIISKETLISISKKRKIKLNKMPDFFKKMSRTLEGAKCILNPIGVAPATMLKLDHSMLMVLPGPPREVRSIFIKRLKGMIEKETSSRSLSKRLLVNMRESEVSPIIDELMSSNRNIYFKPLISEYDPRKGLPIEMIVFDKNIKKCKVRMEEMLILFKDLLSEKGVVISD